MGTDHAGRNRPCHNRHYHAQSPNSHVADITGHDHQNGQTRNCEADVRCHADQGVKRPTPQACKEPECRTHGDPKPGPNQPNVERHWYADQQRIPNISSLGIRTEHMTGFIGDEPQCRRRVDTHRNHVDRIRSDESLGGISKQRCHPLQHKERKENRATNDEFLVSPRVAVVLGWPAFSPNVELSQRSCLRHGHFLP